MMLASTAFGEPVTTAFTYQGQLRQGGTPVTGTYDVEIRLYDIDDPMLGTALATLQRCGVSVRGGLFQLELDFGDRFPGDRRWLQLSVGEAGACSGSQSFTALLPLQELTVTPHAWRASTANEADDADRLDGLPASAFLSTSGGTISGDLDATGTICDANGCIGTAAWADITGKPATFPPSGVRSGDFRIFGELDVTENLETNGDMRIGTNASASNPKLFVGRLVRLEDFFQDTSRVELQGYDSGSTRNGLLLEASGDNGGEIVLYDSQPTVIPNTINKGIEMDGRFGSRGGGILIRDGLNADPAIELLGHNPSAPGSVPTMRVRGGVIVESHDGAGGFVLAEKLAVDEIQVSETFSLGSVEGTPRSSACGPLARGRMQFDPSGDGRLWLCSDNGWRSVVLK
ncbi:MAG: hypothetical protein AAGD06_23000 [Acidobacteriota bacterium]